MSGGDSRSRARREAADRLLETIQRQRDALDEIQIELDRGRRLRERVRERIEDLGGHEADTLFGTWLDSDDRIAIRLGRVIALEREAAEALRSHIAATEVLLFELDPGPDDPRAG